MTKIIDLEEGRLQVSLSKGFRNWKSKFNESFGKDTRLGDLSFETLSFLAQGKDKATFYLYDLIMNLHGWGSGFEFNGLSPKQKMAVIDRFLFVLDRIRFECMKRLGWLESYPGEEHTLVNMVIGFENLAPSLEAETPVLSRGHPRYKDYATMQTHDREGLIRGLIPKALREIRNQSSTL